MQHPSRAISVRRERLALETLHSPYIIKMHASYQSQFSVYFLLDFMEHGDLYENLQGGTEQLKIPCVQFFAAEIVMGLEYLRSLNFVHRDLKLRNVLVDSNFHVKISDFGTAKTIGQSQGDSLIAMVKDKNSYKGTKIFIAPEVWFKEDVSFGTDYWALGLMVYRMYAGSNLGWSYHDETERQYFYKLDRCEWKYPFQHPDRNIHDLIYRVTRRDPELRLGTANFQDLKDHPFFLGIDWDNLHGSQSPGIQFTDSAENSTIIARSVPLLNAPDPPQSPVPPRAADPNFPLLNIPTNLPVVGGERMPHADSIEARVVSPEQQRPPMSVATAHLPHAGPAVTSHSPHAGPAVTPHSPHAGSRAAASPRLHDSAYLSPDAPASPLTRWAGSRRLNESGYQTPSQPGFATPSRAAVRFHEGVRRVTQSFGDMWRRLKSPPPEMDEQELLERRGNDDDEPSIY